MFWQYVYIGWGSVGCAGSLNSVPHITRGGLDITALRRVPASSGPTKRSSSLMSRTDGYQFPSHRVLYASSRVSVSSDVSLCGYGTFLLLFSSISSGVSSVSAVSPYGALRALWWTCVPVFCPRIVLICAVWVVFAVKYVEWEVAIWYVVVPKGSVGFVQSEVVVSDEAWSLEVSLCVDLDRVVGNWCSIGVLCHCPVVHGVVW